MKVIQNLPIPIFLYFVLLYNFGNQVCMTILEKSIEEDCEEAEMLPECFAASCRFVT